ncbi:putative nuclease HARBI1 [Homalodisca vitripennis]|uniref:putative nuclease HARBI1 n=1 Tax=Homalodisca vitripennis TaxID=197043 RepID=UPI001EE9D776|nr:putative nuclease HARBI1 [Homalodisca vitripennis]
MDANAVVALCGGFVCLEEKKRKVRKIWCKNWLKNRNQFSHMSLLQELASNEPNDYKNYLRMTEDCFEDILRRISPDIVKQNSILREPISCKERLAATLQFLASGRTYENLKFSCAISPQSLGKIIPETCTAIYNALREEYLHLPENESDWMNIATDFKKYWQVENCVGALDGKHIAILQPPGSGSYFFNYKGFFSVVLLAVVNANYEFMYVNCGVNGRVSDGGVLFETDFGQQLENGQLNLPSPTTFPNNRDVCLPFVFLGDEAFPLKENLMKPYTNKGITHDERIFNYRICRGRRVVENAFGILANRFQVLQTTIRTSLETTEVIILACCALHNYLRRKSSTYLTPSSVDWENTETAVLTEGEWRKNVRQLLGMKQRNRSGKETSLAEPIRKYYRDFYNNEGQVEFQERMINRR